MSLKDKIATVLDLLADAEELPSAMGAHGSAEPDDLTKIAETYRELSGETLSDEIQTRLTSDRGLREAFAKIAARTPQRPEPLGEPADDPTNIDEQRPGSKEAAERRAYERFERGILALGQR